MNGRWYTNSRFLAVMIFGLMLGSFYLGAQSPTQTLPKLKSGDPMPANLFVELNKAVNPAVVNIFTTYLPKGRMMQRNPYRDPFFDLFEQFMVPDGRVAPQQSLGTGFLIRDDGLIVTNNHVIDKADVIKVQLEERTKETYDARVVGRDARSDIALIKIEAKRKLPFVKMGSSEEVQVGEWVAAFGNPYGYGHTMTKGIVSAIGREIDELNLFPFMQTDASINPGNSGGPLVNTQGLVIGVNTAIDARAQGIGFVIPIDNVKSILPQLEKDGRISRGFIGVQMGDLDEDSAPSLNLKQSEGALVVQVLPNTPADKAGLKPYDLVVEWNGKKIASSRELAKSVATTPVGTKVGIKVLRNGKSQNLAVVIAANADERIAGGGAVGPEEGDGIGGGGRKRPAPSEGIKAPFQVGFAMADYSAALAQEFDLPNLRQPRPVIISVEPKSEAARAGLAPGDVILDINRKETLRAREAVKNFRPGTLNILRVLKFDRVVLVSLRAR